MNKNLFTSKTVLGFGVAGLIGLGGIWNVPGASHITLETIQILAGLLGVYGLRDAL